MRIYQDRTRGRMREAPLAWLIMIGAAFLVVLAAFRAVGDDGSGELIWVLLTSCWFVVTLWFLVRARRRDRAADAADPPRE